MTYQAITTKYLGPTNVRGSRVKASAAAGSITLHWDDSKNSDGNHIAAAEALAIKFGWSGLWHQGTLKSGEGCFVCIRENTPTAFSIVSSRVQS
jgi:hypothetical protein